MALTRKKFYFFSFSSILIAYIWVVVNIIRSSQNGFSPCIFKNITTIPCPSCGSTRSIMALLRGELLESLYWNPLGLLLILILIVAPFWLIFDIIYKKESLLAFYFKVEKIFRMPKFAVIGIALIIINWIWNIYKGL